MWTDQIKNCLVCDKPLEKDRGQKLFCSKDCRRVGFLKELEARPEKIFCAICETIIPQTRTKYCSDRCREYAINRRKKGLPEKNPCPVCGKSLISKGETQKGKHYECGALPEGIIRKKKSYNATRKSDEAKRTLPTLEDAIAFQNGQNYFPVHCIECNKEFPYKAGIKTCSECKHIKEQARKMKRRNGGLITEAMIRDIYARKTCFYCGSQTDNPHIDHIIPISKGGTNARCNLILSCQTCNLSKSNKTVFEWEGAADLLDTKEIEDAYRGFEGEGEIMEQYDRHKELISA